MGNIYRFDLQPWIDKFELENYVETGLGWHVSLDWALKYRFKNFYSVDLDPEMVANAKFLTEKHPNLHIFEGYSTNFLSSQVPEILGNTLFFLDAHFAFSDKGALSYEDSIKKYKKESLPLEQELKIIIENRDVSSDVFILDDFFIFLGDDSCEFAKSRPFEHRKLCADLGIDLNPDFVQGLLGKTHDIQYDNRDQVYLIATPK